MLIASSPGHNLTKSYALVASQAKLPGPSFKEAVTWQIREVLIERDPEMQVVQTQASRHPELDHGKRAKILNINPASCFRSKKCVPSMLR